MTARKLPDGLQARVDWVIDATTNEERQARYDLWARTYDDDIGSIEDYLAPLTTAKIAAQYLAPEARILDAGSGTGLSGEALKAQGFQDIVAVDFSAGMLEIASKKGIYKSLHQFDLGQPTDFADGSFDGVFTCGTTSQMPSASLREFARLVKPGGYIVFSVWPEAFKEQGYEAILEDLEAAGRLSVIHKDAPVQVLPTSEPDMFCEVWVFQVPD
ncbi:MAG: class I SAM-dependent methyltransferase [Pseudomonadota bacterium]